MNIFLRKNLYYIISFTILIWLYGYGINKLYKGGSYFKSQWINKIENKIVDCVIIGNSRASLLSLDEDKINYLNLAHDGVGMKLTYIQLYSFFKNKNNTKYVILQGDYLSFNKVDESRRSPRWLPYFSDPVIFELLKNEHNTFNFHKFFPALNYILFKYDWGFPSTINNLLNISKSPWGNRGYFNVCDKYIDKGPLGSVDFKNYKQNLLWVNKINKLCKLNNSELVIITSPYFKMKDSINDTRSFKTRLKTKNISYFDFSRQFLGNSSYFRDNNHLNCYGVNAFEQILSRVILDLKENDFN